VDFLGDVDIEETDVWDDHVSVSILVRVIDEAVNAFGGHGVGNEFGGAIVFAERDFLEVVAERVHVGLEEGDVFFRRRDRGHSVEVGLLHKSLLKGVVGGSAPW